jgi:predicted GNAT family acetyltransferase
VELNEADEQFEARVGGHVGVLTYSAGDGKLYLLHTEVPEELEGHGVGSALVRRAMDFARERHLRVVPFCPFARVYLERHAKEYGDLLGAE